MVIVRSHAKERNPHHPAPRMTTHPHHRFLPAFALLALTLASCSETSKKGLDLYQQRDYSAALREGERVGSTAESPERERGALVAGMSAFELKNYSESEKWLKIARNSSERSVSGRAGATLGLLHVARDRYSPAALELTAAARKLEGDEAARANFFAGECYSILGRIDAARLRYEESLSQAKDSSLRTRVSARLNSAGYTLQLGAYSNRANADRALAAAARRATSAGLPAPTILSIPDVTGRMIYLVQVGRFASKDEAQSARTRVGQDAVIVQMR